MTVTIYHNPRCSKSRAALALLLERDIRPNIVEYLKTAPSEDTLRDLAAMLGVPARGLLRTGEADYAESGLADATLSDDSVFAAIARFPRLLQRPIVVAGGRARIGRPPENVLEIL